LTREELLELIAEVQQHQSELDDVEVKSARGGGQFTMDWCRQRYNLLLSIIERGVNQNE
jgi:hypothetical protein